MIEIRNVSKVFQSKDSKTYALKDVNLEIETGEIFGIIGQSGAGKSTLLRSFNGLEEPSSGEIIVDGQDILGLSKHDFRTYQKKTAMIFQHYHLLKNKTVYDNVHLPLELHDFDTSLTVDQVLDFVGLTDKASAYPSQLSGGQQQRVGIARALITEPQLLLCDEPTSALDMETAQDIVGVLRKAHDNFGMTILIVTHDLNLVKSLADRAALLEAGQVADVWTVDSGSLYDEFDSYHDLAKQVLGHGDN